MTLVWKELTAAADITKGHLAEAKWPLGLADGTAPWGDFLKLSNETWLGYMKGDDMRVSALKVSAATKKWTETCEMFDGYPDDIKLTDAWDVLNKVEACVFCFKTIKGLEKVHDSEHKLKRYVKARLTAHTNLVARRRSCRQPWSTGSLS